MQRITRLQACALYDCSLDTIKRRIRAGTLKTEKEGTGTFSRVWILLPDAPPPAIATPKPKLPEIPLPYQDQDEPILSQDEEREKADREYARAYLANEVPDSYGTFKDGHNPSLLRTTDVITAVGTKLRPRQAETMKAIITNIMHRECGLQTQLRTKGHIL